MPNPRSGRFRDISPSSVDRQFVPASLTFRRLLAEIPRAGGFLVERCLACEADFVALLNEPLQLGVLQQHDRFSVLDFPGFYHLECLV